MSLHRRDYILRLLEAAAAAIARILKRRQEGDLVGARQEVAATMTTVLGNSAPMVAMVDSRTAADLISDVERVGLYSKLLEMDAELLHDMGQAAKAEAVRRRALEMLLELVIRRAELPDETRERLDGLRAQVDVSMLASRYRDAAAGMQ